MLYLGIDQHARQITISLQDDCGDVILARPVSTRPEKIWAFFKKLTEEMLGERESFVAMLEVHRTRLLQDGLNNLGNHHRGILEHTMAVFAARVALE